MVCEECDVLAINVFVKFFLLQKLMPNPPSQSDCNYFLLVIVNTKRAQRLSPIRLATYVG